MEWHVRDRNKTVRILLNVAGILLIILGALTGWLPGPWFVLGLITGLTLLARNNFWAHERLRNTKEKIKSVRNRVTKKKD